KIAAGLLDHYLARIGYQAQQTSEPDTPDRPDNLWTPADDAQDHNAHGVFDSRAQNRSLQLWANMHRNWLILAGAGIAAALAPTQVRAFRRGSPPASAVGGAPGFSRFSR